MLFEHLQVCLPHRHSEIVGVGGIAGISGILGSIGIVA